VAAVTGEHVDGVTPLALGSEEPGQEDLCAAMTVARGMVVDVQDPHDGQPAMSRGWGSS
jgi:hypothetical protein